MDRAIITGDALRVLPDLPVAPGTAVMSALPDASDVYVDGAPPCFELDYDAWYRRAVTLCYAATAPDCPTVFVQTDRRTGGGIYPKAVIAASIGMDLGLRVVWHRILLRRGPGSTDLHRPTYTHAIAIGSSAVRCGAQSPDVYPAETPLWGDAPGAAQTMLIMRWVANRCRVVLDPFCGYGYFTAAAGVCGRDAVGIEADPVRADLARAMVYPSPQDVLPGLSA